jgi:hypothetical protein
LERVFGIVAGGALATSLAAIIIEQSSIVIVAGILSCIMVRENMLQHLQGYVYMEIRRAA